MIEVQKMLGWTSERLEQMRRLGFVYIKEGHHRKAIDLFEALVVLDKDYAPDLQTLGALHLQVGNAECALPVVERALALEPGHLPTLFHKGKALLMLGERERGLTLLRALEGSADEQVSRLSEALCMSYSE